MNDPHVTPVANQVLLSCGVLTLVACFLLSLASIAAAILFLVG